MRFWLRCRGCGREFEPEKLPMCPECFEPLEVAYDLDAIELDRERLASRPKTIWRYRELLPIKDYGNVVGMRVGYSPLVKCENLGRELGLKELYVKNEARNPTYSFKDRPAEVAVSKAREFGDEVVACASTGNLGASLAAYAAIAGMKCYIIAPYDIEREKLAQIASYGARIIGIEGTFDDARRLALMASEVLNWNVVNFTIRPYYAEGSKTMIYEVAEQLGWELPDHVIIPVASGSLYCMTHKGIEELKALGLVGEKEVKLSGAQAKGCGPIAEAFEEGRDEIEPVKKPNTIAKSIAIGDPYDGKYVLKRARESGGYVYGISDEEIREAIRLLAKTEGIFTEPAGGVVIGMLKRLVEEGKLDGDERVVCYVTGNGLKTMGLMTPYVHESLVKIRPTIEELKAALG